MTVIGTTKSQKPDSPAPWEWWVLGGILLFAGILRLVRPDLAYFNIHVERDLYRALQLLRLEEIPLLGSEMQYGGRVFGPLIYFIYAVPLAFSLSPVTLSLFIGVFNTLVIGVAWWIARFCIGARAALFAAGLYAVFPQEVVQLRYLWNPCFLPAMVLGMYGCFVAYLCRRSRWWLVGTAAFFCAGFQLHFSMLMTIPALLIPAILCRLAPGWKVAAACAAVILLSFSPMIIHELRSDRANIAEVIEAPEIRKSLLERHRPNPNAWRNLIPTVTIDWWEDPYRLGFTYLYFTRERVDSQLGPVLAAIVAAGLTLGGAILLGLWLTGVGTAARVVWKAGLPGLRGTGHEPRLLLLLLLWQFTPVFFLTFMNFHTPVAGEANSIVPIRYYLVTFPAGFLLSGLGFATVLRLTACWPRRRRRAVIVIPLVYLLLCCIFVSLAYLAVMNRTGAALPYLHYRAPSLSVVLDIRDFLLDELGISHEDYYTRVSAQNVFVPFAGELSLDFLITQDGRAMTNPGLDPGTHVLIYGRPFPALPGMDPIPDHAHAPLLPEPVRESGAELVPVYERNHVTIHVIQLADEAHHELFNPDEKRNIYYREQRMKHLGPARR